MSCESRTSPPGYPRGIHRNCGPLGPPVGCPMTTSTGQGHAAGRDLALRGTPRKQLIRRVKARVLPKSTSLPPLIEHGLHRDRSLEVPRREHSARGRVAFQREGQITRQLAGLLSTRTPTSPSSPSCSCPARCSSRVAASSCWRWRPCTAVLRAFNAPRWPPHPPAGPVHRPGGPHRRGGRRSRRSRPSGASRRRSISLTSICRSDCVLA